jgi:hypothetical protein
MCVAQKVWEIALMSDFDGLDDDELNDLSNKVIAEFESACKRAYEDVRLRDGIVSLRNAVDPDETFDRLRDNDPAAARDLLKLGALAMTSSRMILLVQKELMRRGVIPTPNDF